MQNQTVVVILVGVLVVGFVIGLVAMFRSIRRKTQKALVDSYNERVSRARDES